MKYSESKKLGDDAVSGGLCFSCRKRPIYSEHSTRYCEHCFKSKKSANMHYAEKNREKIADTTKKYVKENHEKVVVSRHTHYEKVKTTEEYRSKKKICDAKYEKSPARKAYRKQYSKSDVHKEYNAQYRIEHKDEINARTRDWQKENKEQVAAKQRMWRDANPEKAKITSHNYRVSNRGKLRDIKNIRKTRMEQSGGSFTSLDWKNLCDVVGNVCLRCGKEGNLTIDHIIPISKGGTNTIDNIQPLCRSCNSSKGNRDMTNYLLLGGYTF